MSEVKLTGRAEFDQIYQSLKKMNAETQGALRTLETMGKGANDTLERTAKKTEVNIRNNGNMLRRLSNQLYSDFKALLSLNALEGALKLSSQFHGAIRESLTLSDTIRRLGQSFGVAKNEFGNFQSFMARGLGDIGASSEAAANALQGMAGLGIKGMDSATGFAKGAVMLAGMSGEKGQEGRVAGLLGRVLQAQGKSVNDQQALRDLMGEVTAAVGTTGKASTEVLAAMDQIFTTMDKSLRQRVGPQGMAQMATMASVVGPEATLALQEFLSSGQIGRLPKEMQGFNIFGAGGQVDFKALKSFVDSTKGRIGMDPRASLMTAGFSEQAAEGLLRLSDSSEEVQKALNQLSTATRDTEQRYRETLGIVDSFKGAINTVKGRLEEMSGGVTQVLNDFLASQVGSLGGSAAVAGGGAALAAILAGGGLRGIGKGLLGTAGGLAQSSALETLTGEQVQNVYVTNWQQIAAGGGLGMMGGGGALAKAGKFMLSGAGLAVGGAAAVGLAATQIKWKNEQGEELSAVERLTDFLIDKFGGFEVERARMSETRVKVDVHTKEPNLGVRKQVTRGSK